MPASQGAFGQMSSLVARLYLGPGPDDMVSTGQTGEKGSRDPLPSFSVTLAPAHPRLGLPCVLTGSGRAGADTHVQDQSAPGDAVNGLVEQSCWGGQGGDGTMKSAARHLRNQLPCTDTHHTSGFHSNLQLLSHPGRPDHTAGGPTALAAWPLPPFLPGPSLDLPWPDRAQSGCRCSSVRPSLNPTTVSSLALQSSSTLGVTPGTPECGKEIPCSSREGSSPRPDHSHTHLAHGPAPPAGKGRLPLTPRQPPLHGETHLHTLKPPDKAGPAEGGRPAPHGEGLRAASGS